MVNLNFYILGNPAGQYSQFPDDYTAETLRPLAAATTGRCLRIRRQLNLMEYSYVERLDQDAYIGFNVIFNNAYLTRPRHLLDTLVTLANELVTSSGMLTYNPEGQLVYTVPDFSGIQTIYGQLKRRLQDDITAHPDAYGLQVLTTTFNGEHTEQTLEYNASDADILEAAAQYNTLLLSDDQTPVKHYDFTTDTKKKKSKKNSKTNNSPSAPGTNLVTSSAAPKSSKVWLILTIIFALTTAVFIGLYIKTKDKSDNYLRLYNDTDEELTTTSSRLGRVQEIAEGDGETTYLDSWTSDNHDDNTASDNYYYLTVAKGDMLSLNWRTASESFDHLRIYVDGDEKLDRSGMQSGTWDYVFPSSGQYTVRVAYIKDGSISHSPDIAQVTDVRLQSSPLSAIRQYLSTPE